MICLPWISVLEEHVKRRRVLLLLTLLAVTIGVVLFVLTPTRNAAVTWKNYLTLHSEMSLAEITAVLGPASRVRNKGLTFIWDGPKGEIYVYLNNAKKISWVTYTEDGGGDSFLEAIVRVIRR